MITVVLPKRNEQVKNLFNLLGKKKRERERERRYPVARSLT